MNAFIAAASVMLLIAGLVLIVGWSRGTDPSLPIQPPKRHQRAAILTSRQKVMAVTGVGVGIVYWMISGWPVALVAVPVAFVGIPLAFQKNPEQSALTKLEALENWTRNLAGLIVTGVTLEQAITASYPSAQPVLRPHVGRLVARLGARWPLEDALTQMADDLNDPTGDLVIAHLILAARERGTGLANALSDLSSDVFEEVKARRQIEAERAKPRQNARTMTYITIGVLALLPLASGFFSMYRTPLGQVILAVLLACYVVIILWMRRMSVGRSTPRILALSGGAR